MAKTIPKQVLVGLKSIGTELGEQLKQEAFGVIGVKTGKEAGGAGGNKKSNWADEWLGGAKAMNPAEMNEARMAEEMKKKQEMKELRQSMAMREKGRNVSAEMEELRKKKKRQEEEEEKRRLEAEKQRKKQEEERRRMAVEEAGTPSHKKKKQRGGAFKRGKRKPSMEEMSATGEFGKKGE
ncbi:hypothetical protein DRH14_01065 [Candidatus Shapirobacteria bacterium]|nr:MAG: hypothetical protein DRH14_01065 [Candidatus Shapirobacteria bacterium]